ncbi:MAG TPA: cystathionine gamma-synthase family protein [Longimicrobiales bacterium]|nr:cystathionine gamma-synthase family protein [Longimicrobiales bacterium]
MSAKRRDYRHRTVGGQKLHPETLMMGYGYDPLLSEGALKPPIFHTSTFVFENAQAGKSFFELAYGIRQPEPREVSGLIYSRINNPDLQVLEERLCLWDQAESGLVFSSGMSAIATTLLTFLRPGDCIVHSEPVYGGTEFLLHKVLPQFGIHRVGFRAGAMDELERAVKSAQEQGRVRMIYVETPANPTNALVDIRACADMAAGIAGDDGDGPVVAVDNTFLGPLWQQPLDHGADLVLYSLTKYVGGHSDLIAGACLGAEKHIAQVRGMRTIFGTMADPMTGWLVLRSLETLKLRMTCAMKNARYVAEFLADHPKVRKVYYLGFLDEDTADYEIYRRQCKAPAPTFSFEIDGGEQHAFRVLDALEVIKLAVSLGGTESLAEHPASMTHADVTVEQKERLGISDGMIRLSVGVEHPEDLIADLRQALDVL